MNLWDILILLAVAGAVVSAVVRIRGKKGSCSSCGNCCGSCENCGMNTQEKKGRKQ